MTPPAGGIPLGGGIDLSTLAKPALPEGAYQCDIPEGCGLVTKGKGPHAKLQDCLDTTVPYVRSYFELQERAAEMVEEDKMLLRQNKSLLASNVMLAEKVEEQAKEITALKARA